MRDVRAEGRRRDDRPEGRRLDDNNFFRIFLIRNLISDDDMLPGAAAAVSRVEDPSYGFPSVDPTL